MMTDSADQFERLPSAPIVEAVLHWRADAGKTLDKESLQAELTNRFSAYECREQQEFGAAFQNSAEGLDFRQKTRWDGFRLTGKSEGQHVVQYKPDGLVFSWLKPYNEWNSFVAAALPFWGAYLELAEPPVIQRLGVRFINQVMLDENRTAAYYLRDLPVPPAGLNLSSDHFLYQDRFRVSGTAYRIIWIRTVQSSPATQRALIVDIDVSTEEILSLERDVLRHHFAEMRVLKDELFFQSMTDRAIEEFRKEPNG